MSEERLQLLTIKYLKKELMVSRPQDSRYFVCCLLTILFVNSYYLSVCFHCW